MIKVYLSRQIYDDSEDREEAVLVGDKMIDVGPSLMLYSGCSLLYDKSYDIRKEFIDKIEVD